MKILISSDLYWPMHNGVAKFSRNLALGLAARGHEVLVIAPSQTGRKHEEYDQNYLVKRVASAQFPFYDIKICLTPQRDVRKIIDEFQPDVIHIQMMLALGQAVLRYGNKVGIPIVATNHAMPENLLDNLRMVAPLARTISYILKEYGVRVHAKTDYVTMPTAAAIDMFGVDGSKLGRPLEAVSNGIDLKLFKPTRPSDAIYKKFGIPKNKPIVSYIGRLDKEKHASVLVKAFNKLPKSLKAHLVLVGYGTDDDNLRQLVDELKIKNRVTFTGRVTDEEIIELHKVGTVYCMPSPAELQSIATLEAMASGQPVVAVDAGALKELCQNDRNGFLCDQDDVDQIHAGIKAILTDKKLRDRFSKESLAIAHTHDLEYTLERFEEIYRLVIEK